MITTKKIMTTMKKMKRMMRTKVTTDTIIPVLLVVSNAVDLEVE
jgi:hypothetical protein